MVQGLLREDLEFERTENRSAHRESLVRFVSIDRGGDQGAIDAFSRNISNAGVGVISSDPIPERSTATLTIERLDGTIVKVFAECRWCKPYGKKWQLSGWQFSESAVAREASSIAPRNHAPASPSLQINMPVKHRAFHVSRS